MQFEPHGRMLKSKEVCGFTGLTYWQAHALLVRHGVQIGGQYSISAERIKRLIDDGTVAKAAVKRVGRPKREGD